MFMNNDLEHSKIELKIEALQADLSVRFNSLMNVLESNNNINKQTLEQAKKTNGRVTRAESRIDILEKDIEFIRFLRRKKWVVAVFFLAFLYAYDNFKIEWLLKKIGF